MELTYKKQSCTEINENWIGKEAVLAGWASTIRDLGGIIFVELRDRSGLFQIVADPKINPQVYETFQKLKSEYVIQVKGKVSKRPDDTINEKLQTGTIEMYPDEIKILSAAKTLPFIIEDEAVSEDVRLKYRYLDLRSEKCLKT